MPISKCPVLPRLALFSLLCLVSVPSAALARAPLESMNMPSTLKTEASLMPQIEQMIARSPTFREQCQRLNDADKLVVLLRLNPLLPKGLFRARSTLRRYSTGLLIATVEVAPGSSQPEWIAHEFEHVLEVLDGVKLPDLARASKRGVWQSLDGMIETERATHAGRTVLYETRVVEVSDKYVE